MKKFIFYESILKSYFLLNKKERKKLKLLFFLNIISSSVDIMALTLVLPIIGVLIDPNQVFNNKTISIVFNYFNFNDQKLFIFILVLLAVFAVSIGSIFKYLTLIYSNKFAAKCEIRLGEDLMRLLINAPYSWHVDQKSMILVSVFQTYLNVWSRQVIRQILKIANDLPSFLIPILIFISLSPIQSILPSIFILLLVLIILSFVRRKTTILNSQKKEAGDSLNILLVDLFQGIKDIKLSSNKEYFINVFNKHFNVFSKNYSYVINWNLLIPSLTILLGQAFILIFAFYLFNKGFQGLELTSFMTLVVLLASRVVPSITRLGGSFNQLINVKSWINNLFNIYEELYSFSNSLKKNKNNFKKINWNKISFSEVSFKYKKNSLFELKDLTFNILKGKYYAFVGKSGSGKSTLIDLLAGLLDPSGGLIRIDDIEYKKFGIEKLQSSISFVPQEPLIINGTIKDNVAFGCTNKKIDDSKVLLALKMASLESLISSLSDGIYTYIGDKGSKLSGGEKQRISIARALFFEPQLIILDEATSSLDSINEQFIKKTIENLRGKITVITIAHNFSTILNCDEIFVLDRGKIIEKGNFVGLTKNSILFKKLLKEKEFLEN